MPQHEIAFLEYPRRFCCDTATCLNVRREFHHADHWNATWAAEPNLSATRAAIDWSQSRVALRRFPKERSHASSIHLYCLRRLGDRPRTFAVVSSATDSVPGCEGDQEGGRGNRVGWSEGFGRSLREGLQRRGRE